MSDLEVQKRLWGRDGHGIPGANPNYAGRVGIGAVVIAIIISVGFVTVTDHTPKLPDTRYVNQYNNDVAEGDLLQTRLPLSLQNHPASSTTIVHTLVRTLLTEDRSLMTGHWPIDVQRDIAKFVTINKQEISVLNNYPSASASERTNLLWKQISVAGHALTFDTAIHISLNNDLSDR